MFFHNYLSDFTISNSENRHYICRRNLYFMKNYSVIRLLACLVFCPVVLTAQVAINSVSTVTTLSVSGGNYAASVTSHSGSVNTVSPSTNYNVSYNNNGNIGITSFAYSGKSYVRYDYFDTVIIRRVANASLASNGNKQHIYCQGNAAVDNTTHNMPFPVAFPQVANHAYMERVMKEGMVNRGSDNVFNNDASSDLTFNNIERVDFVYKSGMSTIYPTSAGFLIAERGGNDAFKIAAITAVDVNGNPTSFGSVLTVNTTAYGAAIATLPSYVMRKDVSDNALRPFSLVPAQAVKSVFIRLSDLGITTLQKVYGYALMGADVTATTSAQVLNYTNGTYFPTNTTSATGGMDLASAPGIFHTDLVLSVHFLDMKGQSKNGMQVLAWKDEDFRAVREYQVEKSLDGEHFEKIGIVDPAGASGVYQFTDKQFNATAWYRIRVVNHTGGFYNSDTYYARSTKSMADLSVFPNPATDYLTVSLSGDAQQATRISIYSTDGREQASWQAGNNSRQYRIGLQQLPRGQYFIKITSGEQVVASKQFMKM